MPEAPSQTDPVRVAVLGGGAASLAAAYRLSSDPRYKITVYQMGWRLGGKGATGRRLDDGRVQDHGLHVLGGFYHNAMGMLRKLYDEWAGCSAYPLTFDEAFLPHSIVHIMERGPGGDHPVRFPFPENGFQLGEYPRELNLYTIAEQLLSFIASLCRPDRPLPRGAPYAHDVDFLGMLVEAQAMASPEALSAWEGAAKTKLVDTDAIDRAIAFVQQASMLPPPPDKLQADFGILIEFAFVMVRGILRDGLWWRGFDAINDVEFAEWTKRHGLSERARRSSYFRCGYDYAFAYIDGDENQPSMAAGTGLRGYLRMVLTYNRSIFVHMDGGMGEIVFAPLYEVLKSRGVDFKFFHRVERLAYDRTDNRITHISGTVQNRPIEPAYDPLWPLASKDGKTRMVWPDRPIGSRLQHADAGDDRPEFIYESPWHTSAKAESFELEAGTDYDLCLLGIPVGALADIASELAAGIPEWRTMLDNAATTPTVAAQLWQPVDTAKLGWPHGATILTANAPWHSTWADMSYLLKLERNNNSDHLSYFCGPIRKVAYPSGHDYGRDELQRGTTETRGWCARYLTNLLPNAKLPASAAVGAADELYVRLNSYPSDLYVLTLPKSVDTRLYPGRSKVDNLFLAGDWTRNGQDTGSFETAVLSGLMCARAIMGGKDIFPGERDFGW